MTRAARTLLAVLVVSLLGTGCGTRLNHDEIRAAAGARAGGAPVANAGGLAAATSSSRTAVDGAVSDAFPDVVAGTTAAARSSVSVPRAVASGPAPAGVRIGSALRLAVIGTQSGVAGAVFAPIIQALQVWGRDVNARGGVAGHPVQLEFADDGGDPARARAIVKDQVERRGVLALLNNVDALSGAGIIDYLTQKRVPVIGSDGGSPGNYRSPMYFPQMTSIPALYGQVVASISEQISPQDRQYFGTLACVESTTCTDGDRAYNSSAAAFGMRQVYRARASLTQPDFTAECLAARNAGVRVFLVHLDASSLDRVAASCTRQGFRPIFATITLGVLPRQGRNPALDRMVASSSVFPYFQSGTPATDEFHAVMRRYAPNAALAVGHASGWVSGQLFERAAAHLPEPPTREALLEGLWAIDNDTLGGLTLPLKFNRGVPATPRICWFDLVIRQKAWTTPDGYKLHCR